MTAPSMDAALDRLAELALCISNRQLALEARPMGSQMEDCGLVTMGERSDTEAA